MPATPGPVTASSGCSAPMTTTPDLKPNILVLVLDDVDFSLMEFDEVNPNNRFSNGVLPNLKDFRRRAINFTNYHCTTPLCGPSRASMFTGQYGWKTGVRINRLHDRSSQGFTGGYTIFQNQGPWGLATSQPYLNKNLGTWMSHEGYRTSVIGKYVHADFPNDRFDTHVPPGWDDFISPRGARYYGVGRVVIRDGIRSDSSNSIDRLEIADFQPAWVQNNVLNIDYLKIDVDNYPKDTDERPFPQAEDIDHNGDGILDDGNKALLYRTRVEMAELLKILMDHEPSQTGQPIFSVFAPLCAHRESASARCALGDWDDDPTTPDTIHPSYAGERLWDFDGDGFHDPCGRVDVPHVDSYQWAGINEMLPDWNEMDAADKPIHIRRIPQLSTEEVEDENIAFRNRLRSLKTFDIMLGNLMNYLRNHPDYQSNTYIMLTSDNGYQLGHNRLIAKQVHYDRNSHVPMYVLGPDLNFNPGPGGEFLQRDQLMAQIDIAPTCLELAQRPSLPGQIDGKSFALLLNRTLNPSNWRPDGIVLENWGRKSAVRDDPFRPSIDYSFECTYTALRRNNDVYVVWANGEREHYDLASDPYQINNLATNGAAIPAFEQALQYLKRGLPSPRAIIKNPVSDALLDPEATDHKHFDNGVILEGFGEDDNGVGTVRLEIVNVDNGDYWNGTNWQSNYFQLFADVVNPGDPLVKWTYEFHPPHSSGVTCRVKARTVNVHGEYPEVAVPPASWGSFLAERYFRINGAASRTQIISMDNLLLDTHTNAGAASHVPTNLPQNLAVGTGASKQPAQHVIRGWSQHPDGVSQVWLQIKRAIGPGTFDYWDAGTGTWLPSPHSELATIDQTQGTNVKWHFNFDPPFGNAEYIEIRAHSIEDLGDSIWNPALFIINRRAHD